MAQNPSVKDAACAPLVSAHIFRSVGHDSTLFKYSGELFDKNPELAFSFSEVARLSDAAKENGFDRLTFQLDGWGEGGSDSKFPFVLPPCSAAGGFSGLRDLCEKLASNGHKLALMDQYRDYYLNCTYFNQKDAVVNCDHTFDSLNINYGGEQAFLRADKAAGYVKKTYDALLANGIKPDFVTLDSFACVQPDESFDDNDPLSRSDAAKYRYAVFDYLSEMGISAFGNKQGGLFIDRFALIDENDYETIGVPVPLFDLVYHDSLTITEDMSDGDVLRGFLYARMPSFDLSVLKNADSAKNTRLISDIKKMSELATALSGVEMLEHRFLDVNRTKEMTVFANGYTITADFTNNTCKIEK